MSELNPCPFCGGEPEIRSEPRFRYSVRCRACGAFIDAWSRSADEAAATWNRRSQPANEPLTLEQLREMDGPSPIWKEEPPSGDMTESRVEPVLFNGVHQRGKEEIVCWVTCEAHHANARVEHIAAGRINFYRWPPERSADGKT